VAFIPLFYKYFTPLFGNLQSLPLIKSSAGFEDTMLDYIFTSLTTLKKQIMAQVNAYMTFNGNCEDAFNFYKSVFGGEFKLISRFKDMPPMEGFTLPESAGEKIMHVSLPISTETILMGSDANPMFGDVPKGKNVSLSVGADSKQEADRIFHGLAEGGKITMPISDTFWNAYFGMLVDKYDIIWMVNFDHPKKGA
jgi:PhnB protein